MKIKYFVTFSLILFSSFLSFMFSIKVVYAEKLQNCTELKGTISVTDWPAGATIDVACSGDQGPSGCHGQVQKGLKSGDSFDLNQCTCPPYGDGCLKVGTNLSLSEPHDSENGPIVDVVGDIGVIPGSCSLDSTAGFCSTNYIDAGDVPNFNVTGSCPKPAPACNEACTDSTQCTGESSCSQCLPDSGSTTGKSCKPPAGNTPPPSGNSTPVPTTPPACNTACDRDSNCTGAAARDGCVSCIGGKCTKPSPTPTPPPACNISCTKDSECAGEPARNGCTVCTGGKCNKPTPTPTPPVACNTSCTKDSECAGAKDSCTDCNETTKKCQVAPTPTPVFNENWCICDGLDTSPASFFPGDSVSFISYGKVEAPYLTRAKVDSMNFYVYRGDATTATRVADSGAVPSTLESQSSTKNRYKSTWGYKIPTDIKQGEIFRVQSKIKCVAQNVLGASIKYEPTLIDRIVSFIGYLFGLTPQPVATDYQKMPIPSESAMVSTRPSPAVLAAQNSLQIGTFTEAKIIEKSCSIVRFKFGN